jgi:hypothetical protein
MKMRSLKALAGAAALGFVASLAAQGQAPDKFIIVQSTTSTENSGLFKHLLPMFTKKTGIEVRVVAVGTGQSIKNAQNGDGDVLFVHDKASEEKFVAEGFGVALVSYRLSPKVKCPVYLEDAAASVAWTHANIGKCRFVLLYGFRRLLTSIRDSRTSSGVSLVLPINPPDQVPFLPLPRASFRWLSVSLHRQRGCPASRSSFPQFVCATVWAKLAVGAVQGPLSRTAR